MSESPIDQHALAPGKAERYHAIFQARLVPYLAPFLPRADVNPYLEGLLVEPSPGGGVNLVAASDAAVCWIHDPTGEASEPLFLALPHKLVRACTPARGPALIDQDGDELDDYSLPDWVLPGRLHVIGDRTPERVPGEHRLVLVDLASKESSVPSEAMGYEGEPVPAGLYCRGDSRIPPLQDQAVRWRSVFEKHTTPCEQLILSTGLLAHLAVFADAQCAIDGISVGLSGWRIKFTDDGFAVLRLQYPLALGGATVAVAIAPIVEVTSDALESEGEDR